MARIALELSNLAFLAAPAHSIYTASKIDRSAVDPNRSETEVRVRQFNRLMPEILGGIFTTTASMLYHSCADGTPRPACPLPWPLLYCLDFIFGYQLVISAALYTRIDVDGIERWKWICHLTAFVMNICFVVFVQQKPDGERWIPILYGLMVVGCATANFVRYRRWPAETAAEWRSTRIRYAVLALVLISGGIWSQIDAVRIEWQTNYATLDDGFWYRHSIWHVCCGTAYWSRCMVVAPPVDVLLNLDDPAGSTNESANEFRLLDRPPSSLSVPLPVDDPTVPPYPTFANFAVL
jgi:hypothetical protein